MGNSEKKGAHTLRKRKVCRILHFSKDRRGAYWFSYLKFEDGALAIKCNRMLLFYYHFAKKHKIYILNLKKKKDEAREPKEANKACV